MKALLLTIFLLVTWQVTYGQITGRLTDPSGQAIPYATITLLQAADSTIIYATLTTEKGEYILEDLTEGRYLVRMSTLGYQTIFTPVFELANNRLNKDLGIHVLRESTQQLAEMVVRSEKPLLEQRADGTVVNVEKSIMSKGSSVLEVLERSPGVVIDHQNNGISLNGKTGVMVMLNGKSVRMALEQVVTMLGAMSANDISKIELLTNPSSAYDAEGSAGIINIVTKKNSQRGTNGSISLTGGYGYGEKATGGLSLNRHTGETNIYGAYTYSRDKAYSDFHAIGSEQEPLLGGHASSDFLSISRSVLNNHQANFGIDTQLKKGFLIGTNANFNSSNTSIQTMNRGKYKIQPDDFYQLNAAVNGVNSWRSFAPNFYAEKEPRKGEKILLNLDYISYRNAYPMDAKSSFLDQNGNQAGSNDTLFSPVSKGLSNTQIGIWATKLDYRKQVGAITVETGLKGVQTRTDSKSAIQSFVNNEYVSRPSAVSRIVMKERIGAAYFSAAIKVDSSTSIVAGLRYEYSSTRMDNPLDGKNIANRQLGIWFPSFLMSKKLGSNAEFLVSYSKRISRPSYSDLASYVTYNGPGSVNTGNPLLKPTITNNVKLSYNYLRYSFSALLSRDDRPIARNQMVYTTDKLQMAVSPQNMIFQNNFTFQLSLPFTISSWWEMNYDVNSGWRSFKLDYTPQPVSKTYFAYNLVTSQIFKLPARFSIEISGYYNSAFYNGSRKVDGYGTVNAGIKKELKNNHGSFQLAVSDPFRTNVISSYFGSLTQEVFDLRSHVNFHPESSKYFLFKLSYSRPIGKTAPEKAGRSDNASQLEKDRLK